MKSKGHIYMANLMLEELETEGVLSIDYNGKMEKHKVPDMIKKAILSYPSHFRAGAVGPDFFPDMLMGQMYIHPENSGKWLKMMYEELCAMPPQDEETKQALAFYMGYMLHYAGDMFTHHYVNSYAKGWFPDISGILEKYKKGNSAEATEDILIILRHLAVEAYMDDYIVKGLEDTGHEDWVEQDQTVLIPKEYLRSCFGTYAAMKRAEEITGEGFEEPETDSLNFLGTYVFYLEKYRKESLRNSDLANNGGADEDEEYNNHTRKVADDIQKMEETIDKWLSFWETFVQKSLTHGTYTALSESDSELSILIPEYLTQDEKILDKYYFIKGVIDFFGAIHIHIPIISELIDYISKKIKEMLKEFAYPYAREVATIIAGEEGSEDIDDFDDAIEVIKGAFLNPAHLINNPRIFDETVSGEKLEAEWDNLGKVVDGNKISFLPFYRGYIMGKLCMIGVDGLNGIMKQYGQSECFEKGKISASVQSLTVIVNTAGERYADTNKDVFFRIIRKESEPVILALAEDWIDFRKNWQDIFELNLPCTIPLCDIERFELQLVGKNLWIYKDITVKDTRTGIVLAKGERQKLYHKDIVEVPLFENLVEAYKNCTLVNSVFKLGVTITTGTEMWSGTDNDVIISVHMKDGRFIKRVLDKSLYNDFENGDVDTYYLTLDKPVQLEEIECFGIRKNGSDDWKVDCFMVFDADTDNCLCRAFINDWVGSVERQFPVFDIATIEDNAEIDDEEMIQRILVTIKTKKTGYGGTNSDVYVRINYKDENDMGASKEYRIDTPWHDDFEQGDTDTFIVRLRQAIRKKDIVSFELFKVGEDDWCVERFSVYDADRLYHFGSHGEQWIRTENDMIPISARR